MYAAAVSKLPHRSPYAFNYKKGIKRAILSAFSRKELHKSFRRFERDIKKRQVSSTATSLVS